MIRKIFNKISNPLLFYVEKTGRSVFRNYCLMNNDGYAYNEAYSIQTAGKALEYRMEADKKLNLLYILITIIVYCIFINLKLSLLNFILCELLWIFLISLCRFICSEMYRKFLIKNFGTYTLTNFNPPVNKEKIKTYKRNFKAKLTLIAIIIFIIFLPAFIMIGILKTDIKSKKPHFKADIVISKIYNTFYPKTEKIYDMSAYAKYNIENFDGAIKDYKKIFDLSGKTFSKKDFVRFANLLYLEKKLYGSQTAIDSFNEYYTKKRMSITEESQMLWIKSIFSIGNNKSDFVIQDYDDLLMSLKDKDYKNRFYITSDKAYMLYLMRDYENALTIYNELVDFAQQNKDLNKELPRLLAERGFTRRALGHNLEADDDFVQSKIDMYELDSYEPVLNKQGFIADKF